MCSASDSEDSDESQSIEATRDVDELLAAEADMVAVNLPPCAKSPGSLDPCAFAPDTPLPGFAEIDTLRHWSGQLTGPPGSSLCLMLRRWRIQEALVVKSGDCFFVVW